MSRRARSARRSWRAHGAHAGLLGASRRTATGAAAGERALLTGLEVLRAPARAGLRSAGTVLTFLDLMGFKPEVQEETEATAEARAAGAGDGPAGLGEDETGASDRQAPQAGQTASPAAQAGPAGGAPAQQERAADAADQEDLPAALLAIEGSFDRLEQAVRRLDRVNFHGRTVNLAGGVAAAAGVLSAALQPARQARRSGVGAAVARRARLVSAAALVAGAGAAGAGLADDLDQGAHDGDGPAKGLRGHLAALAHGHVTTGVAKIGVIGTGAVLAGTMLALASIPSCDRGSSRATICHGLAGRGPSGVPAGAPAAACPLPGRGRALAVDAAVRAVAIASWANVHNLLDLRPGRALKVAGLLSGVLLVAARPPAARLVQAAGTVADSGRLLAGGALGVVSFSLPTDLGETTMLGDTGANAVGALVGTAMACLPSRRARLVAAATGTVLVLVSEKVSYSAVIARTPVLAALDGWGRREEP